MISESQERMVAAVRPQMLDAVREVCARWELPCTVIGEVTDDGDLRAFHDGDVVGEIAARLLTDECPRYEVERRAREGSEAAAPHARATSRSGGSTSSTTTSSGREPCGGPDSTPPCCAAFAAVHAGGLAVSLQERGDAASGPFAAGRRLP